MQKLRVTILYDGMEDQEKAKAAESGRPLVLVSEKLEETLRERGHDVRRLSAAARAFDLADQIARDDGDVIFNVCEAFAGVAEQEQHVAALLEMFGKRFTGSGSIGLALAQDKALAKKLLNFHGIATPKFTVMHEGEVDHADDFGFPMFIKPATSDASIGIDEGSIVRSVKELMERISWIQTEFAVPALIEEFVEGREIYIGVLGGDRPEALPILEWDMSKLPDDVPRIATSEAKWDRNNPAFRMPEVFPDDIPEPVRKTLQDAAVEAFKALKLRDYGRIDLRLRRKPDGPEDAPDGWDFFLIEVNPNPHLAPDGELALAAKRHGLSYGELLERILANALTREH